jgi:non-ribosomal peptide synthetase component F
VDELSTLLAQYLYHTGGVRPGDSTGIFMERSWQFVIVYIAALKAGGAYMPLEVVYPKVRCASCERSEHKKRARAA